MSLTANTVNTTTSTTSFTPEMIGRTRVTGEVNSAGTGHTLIYTCPADTLGVLKPQYIYMNSGLSSMFYISADQSTVMSRSFIFQNNTNIIHVVRITEDEFVGFSNSDITDHVSFSAAVSSANIPVKTEDAYNSKYIQTINANNTTIYATHALRSQILIDAGDSIWLYDPNGNLQSIWDFLIEEYAI